MAAMRWADDYQLLVIGSIAITAGSIGYLHRRRRRPGDTVHITGMGTSYIALSPLWSHLPQIAYRVLVLPSLIGLPLVARAVRRSHAPTGAYGATPTAPPTAQHWGVRGPRGRPYAKPRISSAGFIEDRIAEPTHGLEAATGHPHIKRSYDPHRGPSRAPRS
jgi:hypothetical protein